LNGKSAISEGKLYDMEGILADVPQRYTLALGAIGGNAQKFHTGWLPFQARSPIAVTEPPPIASVISEFCEQLSITGKVHRLGCYDGFRSGKLRVLPIIVPRAIREDLNPCDTGGTIGGLEFYRAADCCSQREAGRHGVSSLTCWEETTT